ncbi:SIR2 family protein [Bacillus sp. FSL W8-0183]|uniref:SIR2 family protein n=1 Tax=Bacillus sp. FSL W8-0183 TaxID=2954568 RepID=UPI0030FA300E
MTTILDKFIKENEFPTVFIGSGISKRFLVDFPDWSSLLNEFWEKLDEPQDFFGEFNIIRDEIKNKSPKYTNKELDHYSNIEMGTRLESKYNQAFNEGRVSIENFGTKDAFDTKVSPFKKAIANRFNSYKLIDEMKEEFEIFKKMLSKTQIVLTTNYDYFIENSYNEYSNYSLTKFIGQKGFFSTNYGYAELYKLHGCAESPQDIIITENDYNNFEENSVLISAKIISTMMHSPIIFMGYSLTDINIRKIIREFTKSLNDKEIEILEDRLVLIQWKEGCEELVQEVENDRDLGCKLKVIKTDNFKLIFEKLSTINQGVAPTEVRKYHHVIKELIIDRGKKGTLNSVLISPIEIDNIKETLQNKNITVALGDSTYIFQIPDIITYSLDYISDKDEIGNEIRMRFAVNQAYRARFPIVKLLNEDLINSTGLHKTEKERLIQKIEYFTNFELHYCKIVPSSVMLRNCNDLNKIIKLKTKDDNIYETLSFNIKELKLEELKTYLIRVLTDLKQKGEIKLTTQLRRLLLLYDIIKNKGNNA